MVSKVHSSVIGNTVIYACYQPLRWSIATNWTAKNTFLSGKDSRHSANTTNTITRSSSLTPVSYGEALKTTVVLAADVSCV